MITVKAPVSLLCAALAVIASAGATCVKAEISPPRPISANVIVPQARMPASELKGGITVTAVAVQVNVNDQSATTVMEINLRNGSGRPQEAELMVPAPDGAVVRAFSFEGADKGSTAEVLTAAEARILYEAVVARTRDPALLEFISCSLIRSSVFLVEASGTQKLRLTWEQALPADGDRVDYLLPRTESVAYSVPWKIAVSIKSARPISTVYSPSHRLDFSRQSEHEVAASLSGDAATVPGPFRLSFLRQHGDVTASLFACPDAETGGYFLLLAGLPAKAEHPDESPAVKREVTLLLDRCGSMNGEKMHQVREVARLTIASLEPGEKFNIIVYNEKPSLFATEPVGKSDETARLARDYVNAIEPRGGSNLYDALAEALRPAPARGALPIVLFLTDGLPTVGRKSEKAIRDLVVNSNPYHRRIFTFGVGFDVNTPLLEKIAQETRARATFVLPSEDLRSKVAEVFSELAGPVLSDPKLLIRREKDGESAPVSDILPARIPDLFEGDQLVVLGRYAGTQPLEFILSGKFRGRDATFRFSFDMDKAGVRNGFVARLWASRKIASLIDAVREMGADAAPLVQKTVPSAENPKLKDLVNEIVRLSAEYGILTEYTAFLARESTDLSDLPLIEEAARDNLEQNAMRVRFGQGAVSQTLNTQALSNQAQLNPMNGYFDNNLKRVSVANVQQFNGDVYYLRGGCWVDGRLAQEEAAAKSARVIERGSPEFEELLNQLAAQGREAALSLNGDVLIQVNRETVRVKDRIALAK